jgi:mono/diheme cytochrome c family protein
MRTVLVTLLAVLLLTIAGAFTFIYAGVYDVAANQPHWPITYWAMETVRKQSVKMRASGITPPLDLTNEASVLAGTEHYAAHCASCHGAPGVPRSDLGERLYPLPADLTRRPSYFGF